MDLIIKEKIAEVTPPYLQKYDALDLFQKSMNYLYLRKFDTAISMEQSIETEFENDFLADALKETKEYCQKEYMRDVIHERIIQTELNSQFESEQTDDIDWKNYFEKQCRCYSLYHEMSQRESSLLNAILLFYVTKKELRETSFEIVDELVTLRSQFVLLNNWMADIFMKYDFELHDNLYIDGNYNPSLTITDYLSSVSRYILAIDKMQEQKNVCEEYGELRELEIAIDKKNILTMFGFLELQISLLILSNSPFYSTSTKRIAKELSLAFKCFSGSRIFGIIIDPAIISGSVVLGVKKTTCIKIFFQLDNGDQYCMRIDFPHEGAEYIHINLHEPEDSSAAFPVSINVIKDLFKKYPEAKGLFFEYNNRWWFRNNFLEKLKAITENEEIPMFQELSELFARQCHYSPFSGVTVGEMIEFLGEFGSAISRLDVSGITYQATGIEDIRLYFQTIRINEIVHLTILDCILLMMNDRFNYYDYKSRQRLFVINLCENFPDIFEKSGLNLDWGEDKTFSEILFDLLPEFGNI